MRGSSKQLFVGVVLILCAALACILMSVVGSSSESQTHSGAARVKRKSLMLGRTSSRAEHSVGEIDKGSSSTSPSHSLQEFKDRYSVILKNLRGKEARKASYSLIGEAQLALSISELKEFCSGLDSLELWQHGMGLIAEKYATEDYNGGLQWLNTLPKDSSSLPAFMNFAKAVATGSQEALLDYALNRTDKNETGALLAGLLSTGNEATSLKVIALANKQSDLMPSLLFPLSTAVLPFVGSGDYQTASKISEAIAQQSERHDALRNLMISAAQDDPVVASDLLSHIKTDKDRLVMVDPLITSWIAIDPKAASSWATAQESQLIRDGAFTSISRSLLTVSQDEAISWAQSISDPKLRESQIGKVRGFVKANGTQADLARLENQLKTK